MWSFDFDVAENQVNLASWNITLTIIFSQKAAKERKGMAVDAVCAVVQNCEKMYTV